MIKSLLCETSTVFAKWRRFKINGIENDAMYQFIKKITHKTKNIAIFRKFHLYQNEDLQCAKIKKCRYFFSSSCWKRL